MADITSSKGKNTAKQEEPKVDDRVLLQQLKPPMQRTPGFFSESHVQSHLSVLVEKTINRFGAQNFDNIQKGNQLEKKFLAELREALALKAGVKLAFNWAPIGRQDENKKLFILTIATNEGSEAKAENAFTAAGIISRGSDSRARIGFIFLRCENRPEGKDRTLKFLRSCLDEKSPLLPNVLTAAAREAAGILTVGEGAGMIALNKEREQKYGVNVVQDFLSDPSLSQLGEVVLKFPRGSDPRPKTFSLDDRGESATWVTRWLHQRDQPVNEKTVAEAIDRLDNLRGKYFDIKLFHERNIVVAADGQSVIDILPAKSRNIASYLVKARGGEDLFFGTKQMLESLKVAAGPSGDVRLVRAVPPLVNRIADILKGFSAGEGFAVAASNDPKSQEDRKWVISEMSKVFRSLFDIKDVDPLAITVKAEPRVPGDDRNEYSVQIQSGREVLANLQFRRNMNGGGELTKVELSERVKKLPNAEGISPQQGKKNILTAIETTRPGKGGFVFIFNGHGSPEAISVATRQFDRSQFPQGEALLSPSDVAQAIRKRAELAQRTGTSVKGDVYFFASCFSKEWVYEMAEAIKDLEDPPILAAATEHGQVSASTVVDMMSSQIINKLMEIVAKERKNVTLGDFMRLLPLNREQMFSNPTLWIPRTGEERKKVGPGYDQISQAELFGKDLA